jgi:hypothetical protein
VSVRMAARLEEFRIKQQQLCDLEQLLRQKLLSLERREAELGIAERAAETQRLQSQQILEARSSELVESKRRIREELTEALKAAKVHFVVQQHSLICFLTCCRLPRKPAMSVAQRPRSGLKTQSFGARRLRRNIPSTEKTNAGARMVACLQVFYVFHVVAPQPSHTLISAENAALKAKLECSQQLIDRIELEQQQLRSALHHAVKEVSELKNRSRVAGAEAVQVQAAFASDFAEVGFSFYYVLPRI